MSESCLFQMIPLINHRAEVVPLISLSLTSSVQNVDPRLSYFASRLVGDNHLNVSRALVYSQTARCDWNKANVFISVFHQRIWIQEAPEWSQIRNHGKGNTNCLSLVSLTQTHALFQRLSSLFISSYRHRTSPYWSPVGRLRKRWPCWRQSWTVVLETG